jgi:ribosomal protein S27AE/GNAT superfamily N-acetyltransferase
MSARFTYDYVKNLLKEHDYTLLSDTYQNNQQKLKMICPSGHTIEIALNNFISGGVRCWICRGKKRYTLEDVKNIFNEYKYTLLSNVYKNAHQKLETLCPNGHRYLVALDGFLYAKSRCPTCQNIKNYSYEEIKQIFEQEGYVLLSNEYKNAHQKLDLICPNGHRTQMTLNSFKDSGARCIICAGVKKYTLEEVYAIFKQNGYTLLSTEYSGVHSLMKTLCPNGHEYQVTLTNFKNHNRRCPKCNNHGTSLAELSLADWIKSYYPDARKIKIFHDKNNKKAFFEYDICVEQLKLCIEFNGLYYHGENFKCNTSYHLNKLKIANRYGYRLISIFEDEWARRPNQVKNFLLSVMGLNSRKIGARHTDARQVDKKEAKRFLDEYHIQGVRTMDIAYGLYNGEELVAVMTGSRHHRQGHTSSFVLSRLAFKQDVTVYGGASRLLKSLINYCKENNYNRLISWSDNRWSEGKVYKEMGFKLEKEYRPDYSYCYKDRRFSKQSCTKKKLLKLGGTGNTEKQMAESIEYYRIWDCGKKLWLLSV